MRILFIPFYTAKDINDIMLMAVSTVDEQKKKRRIKSDTL